jgi:hypothetical protein
VIGQLTWLTELHWHHSPTLTDIGLEQLTTLTNLDRLWLNSCSGLQWSDKDFFDSQHGKVSCLAQLWVPLTWPTSSALEGLNFEPMRVCIAKASGNVAAPGLPAMCSSSLFALMHATEQKACYAPGCPS